MDVTYETRFGSLEDYEKGRVEIIDGDPKHFAFSNIFEVAATSPAYEKVAVGKNRQYVLEAIRAEGTSEWRSCKHDEFALVLDGEVEIRLVKPAGVDLSQGEQHEATALEGAPLGRDDTDHLHEDATGSVALDGEPEGDRMGVITARRGHMALLPGGAAYQFHADRPGVILQQTIEGPDTVYKWAEICQTQP